MKAILGETWVKTGSTDFSGRTDLRCNMAIFEFVGTKYSLDQFDYPIPPGVKQ